MKVRLPWPPVRPRRTWTPYLVLGGALLLTTVATAYVATVARAKDQIRFENAVQRTEDAIQNRLETYIALLRSSSGLFAVNERLTSAQFRTYVKQVELGRRYPGTQGIGFSVRLRADDKDAFVGEMRQQGFTNFAIQPDFPRAEYHAIIYLEPFDQRNRAALGFDMFTEPVRRAAMEQARDTGAAAASGRVTLLQEIEQNKQAGFLIYVPLYRTGDTPGTVAGRRSALQGFVYSPFRADDLMAGIFGNEQYPAVEFQIYDGSDRNPQNLLHRSDRLRIHQRLPYRPRFTTSRAIAIAGRAWHITFTSSPEFELASSKSFVPYIALSGIGLSLALFWVTRSQVQARSVAERSLAELYQSEQALRQSEERFRTLIEQSPWSTQIFAPDGRTIQVNQAWEELWGITLEQLGDYNVLADQQLVEKGLMPYLQRGFAGVATAIPAVLYDLEATLPGVASRSDSQCWVRAFIYPVKDKLGRPREVVLMHEDITEQKQIETALRNSEGRFRRLFEADIIGLFFAGRTGNILEANHAFLQMVGYTPEDLSAGRLRWDALTPVEYRYLDEQAILEDQRGGVCSAYEKEFIRKDGSRIPVLVGGARLEEDPNVGITFALDLTERKRAEEALRFLAQASTVLASSLEYETTLTSVAQLVVPTLADWCGVDIIQPDGAVQQLVVAHVDPAKVELGHKLRQQYPLDPNASTGLAQVLRTGHSELYPEVTDAMLVQGARDPQHLELMREIGFKSLMIVPLVAREQILGAIIFVAAESGRRYGKADLALAEDLARRVAIAVDNARLYAIAQQERTQAENANRTKDEFLATLSHELRTPLNAMLGWTQLLRSRQFDEAMVARALETVERNTRSLATLIEDILDVSRIITGKLRLKVRPVDLVVVIEAAIETVRPAADAKQILLQSVLDSSASPISGDSDRLQQIVWNLLSNAIKFTPSGGRVQIQLARSQTQAEVIISDTGRGISPEFLPYIWERFRQADSSTTRSYGGLGLGLAIVRHLVELHGGVVQAESLGEDQGATFRVKLPLITARLESISPEPASTTSSNLGVLEPSIDLQGLRVLVVDDEPDAREFVATALEQCGASVIAAASATEALAAIQQQRPDVLVSDIGMPEIDGYTLIHQVRSLPVEQGGRIPAAALTAYAREDDRNRALLAGFQLHVPKPVSPSDLIATVAHLAGRTTPHST
ncbi:CHASE domain-containing protein [Trichocoleus sp. FACHB-591]|uniref:CHASE domain-containing protein n=1 Tax=Trichocoleus sp. FACHB-591 TaxID=2692872 RepID=UPI0016823D9A|nr:CHASE domain-containing protein [Trichocoleus sp. FACHB-591]MBD2094648.1 CHASE domain-containing protein [Trichocoleus sp. FACHB-591]